MGYIISLVPESQTFLLLHPYFLTSKDKIVICPSNYYCCVIRKFVW